jgi:hypothetical protein
MLIRRHTSIFSAEALAAIISIERLSKVGKDINQNGARWGAPFFKQVIN